MRKLKRLFNHLCKVIRVFLKQPRMAARELLHLPKILRGFNYSKDWSPLPDTHPVTSSLSCPSEPSQHLNPLRSYFDSHDKGKIIHKWLHYFPVYHKHFKKFVGCNVNMLEVGVAHGGSLGLWRDYFGAKSRIYGVDIEEKCKQHENEYTNIFIGDQADRRFWGAFKDLVPRIDILIDDGGHVSEQQIVTFEEMFSCISPGGVYLCEDIHGVNNEFAAYLYGLVKSLNAFNDPVLAGVSPSGFQSWVKSINFYPYIVVIEKAEKPENIFIAPQRGSE